MNEDSFLKLCRKSSQDTYQAFKELLSCLENPNSRLEAISFWHELVTRLIKTHSAEEMEKEYHFSLSKVAFRQEDRKMTHLTLLQLPSTFAPEEWSYTFFEGLGRYKHSEFQDTTIAELGCGIGWITLALAIQTKPKKIYGLDINPKAILCSRINLFLNSFDHKGNAVWTHQGRTLVDVVEFHQSDLLEYCRQNKIFIDRVIGCIPQVLNPDPEFASRVLARKGLEQANDEFLHSLSNYTVDQGYIEDQFGLGLIARAVEESVDVLRVSGKVILNLGGRPGSEVLIRLFTRRGFVVHPIWHTRVTQAKDTDIRHLVSIEEKTPHRFEFYMGYGNDTPVNAKTALAFAEAGGEIAHGLTVYEANLRDPLHLPKILQFMRQEDYGNARQLIDLSYADDSLSIEKMSYLNALTEHLQEGKAFPYEKTAGLQKLREDLGSFFRRYFKIPFEEESFLITPSREVICENILQTFQPRKVLLDSQLSAMLGYWPEALEVPRRSDLLCELIEKLRPEIVIYSLPQSEAESRESFLRICEISEKVSCRVFLDISDLIDLSSTPKSNGIFRYLSKNPLPDHVNLICGLVKNRLYQDLEVCFLISKNKTLLENLEAVAELTYSRTPVLSQLYYNRILQELINFQIVETRSNRSKSKQTGFRETPSFQKDYIQLAPTSSLAFTHPAIAAESASRAPNLIRLDYGENTLPTPKSLRRALFEAFAKMQISTEESDCDPEVLEVVQSRFLFDHSKPMSVQYGCGVAPLFSKISHGCAKQNYTLVFPGGAYGHFVATAHFHGAKTIILPTTFEDRFKLNPKTLEKALSEISRTQTTAYVILNAPLVNPTGAQYSPGELNALFGIIEKHKAVVILDSIFSGLEFEESISNRLPDLRHAPSLRWAVLGGLSKEFAAGGLRIGYGVSSDPEIVSFWQKSLLPAPHATLKYTLKKVYTDLLRRNPELLAELKNQKLELKTRAKELSEVLRTSGWDPLPSDGGLFLSATPSDPKKVERLEELLREKTGVVINSPTWTGIPGYFRFVLSTSRDQFDRALEKLGQPWPS